MRKFLLIPVLILAAASAHADDGSPDTSVYAGAGIMSSDVQNIEGTGFNIDNTSVKALAGLRFSLIGAAPLTSWVSAAGAAASTCSTETVRALPLPSAALAWLCGSKTIAPPAITATPAVAAATVIVVRPRLNTRQNSLMLTLRS